MTQEVLALCPKDILILRRYSDLVVVADGSPGETPGLCRFRLVVRHVGLSKNTFGAILKRSWQQAA